MQTSRSRVFGLDLARAAAISFVVAGHAAQAVFQWRWGAPVPGWAPYMARHGVDLFFALSGWLIGGLLFEAAERGAGARGWLRFMARRWLRTVPAYWAVLLLSLALVGPGERLSFAARYAVFTQNLWHVTGPGPFGVSWSLSVEEWFYFLFSAAMIAAWRFGGKRGAWAVVAVFLTVPHALRIVHAFGYGTAHGFGAEEIVPLRLDAIAYGVALALLDRDWRLLRRALPPVLLGAGIFFLFTAPELGVGTLPIWAGYAGRPAMMAGLSLCVLGLSRIPHGPGGAVAGCVRRIADLSYSVYLTHLSVTAVCFMAAWRIGVHRWWPVYMAAAAGSAAAACILHYAVELPIMRCRPPQFAAQPVLPGAAAAVGAPAD